MNKRRSEGEQTKQHIAEQTMLLFSQKGYAATSMEDICAATGCSKGSIYHHFKSKEDLFLYLAERAFTEFRDKWEEISRQYESATEKLYVLADYAVDSFRGPLNITGEEFLARTEGDPQSAQKMFAIINICTDVFEKLASEGIDRGEFRNVDPKELAFAILTFHIGLSHTCHAMDKNTMKTAYRKATALLLDGIRSRTDP